MSTHLPVNLFGELLFAPLCGRIILRRTFPQCGDSVQTMVHIMICWWWLRSSSMHAKMMTLLHGCRTSWWGHLQSEWKKCKYSSWHSWWDWILKISHHGITRVTCLYVAYLSIRIESLGIVMKAVCKIMLDFHYVGFLHCQNTCCFGVCRRFNWNSRCCSAEWVRRVDRWCVLIVCWCYGWCEYQLNIHVALLKTDSDCSLSVLLQFITHGTL